MSGYDIWTHYGRMGYELVKALHSESKYMVALTLDELIEEESNITGGVKKTFKRMAATHMGKELQGKIDPEFTIVAHVQTKPKPSGEGVTHQFLIKPDGLTTARTPMDMFPDKNFIGNDIMEIIKEIERVGL